MKCRPPYPRPLVILFFLLRARLSLTRPPNDDLHSTSVSITPGYIQAATPPQVTPILPVAKPSQEGPLLFHVTRDANPGMIGTTLGQEKPVSNRTSRADSSADSNPNASAGTGNEWDGYIDYYYEEMDFSLLEMLSDNRTAGSMPPPGLSRVAKLKLIKTPRRKPPEYMLDLYDRFSRLAPPVTAKTTPSGPDIDEDLPADIVRSFPNINKEEPTMDQSSSQYTEHEEGQLAGIETRYHTLVFNITSLSPGEEVARAELRLYTLVARDRNTYVGVDRLVTVHEGLSARHSEPITWRHVYGSSSGWEAFDVTEVVRRWVGTWRKTDEIGDGVQVLEVTISSVFQVSESHEQPVVKVDIDVDPEHNEGPLLVVFSRDVRRKRQRELHNLIIHEAGVEDSDIVDEYHGTDKEILGAAEMLSSGRKRRNSSRQPHEEYTSPKFANGSDVLSRERREKPQRVKRNSCRRKQLYVDFQEINWHQWIIAPPGYQAFECVGKCYVPIGSHLSPTNHAIIQTLVHAAHPKRAARACCVPTKLEPISILYLDENNIITYKYHYDGMVVAECGCR